MSYSLGSSRYRKINTNKWIPFKFDQRHSLKIFANVKLWGNWRLSLLGQGASGLPFTDVIGTRFRNIFDWDFVRGSRNMANFPFFYRLDARLSYQYRVGEKAFNFYLDFINLTNRKNIYDIIWDKELIVEPTAVFLAARKRTFYMFPFVPSFGISFRL